MLNAPEHRHRERRLHSSRERPNNKDRKFLQSYSNLIQQNVTHAPERAVSDITSHLPLKPKFNFQVELYIPKDSNFPDEVGQPPPKPIFEIPEGLNFNALINETVRDLKKSKSANDTTRWTAVTTVSNGSLPVITKHQFCAENVDDLTDSRIQLLNVPFVSKGFADIQSSIEFVVPEIIQKPTAKEILRSRFQTLWQYAKNAMAFLLSHIGLTCLVLGYTIVGGLMFCAVERKAEQMVKEEMTVYLNQTLHELMDMWLISHINLQTKIEMIHKLLKNLENDDIYSRISRKLDNTTIIEGLKWYMQGVELSKDIIPEHWIEDILSNTNNASSDRPILNSTAHSNADIENKFPAAITNDHWEAFLHNAMNITEINSTRVVENARKNFTIIMSKCINQVIYAVKERGWNGATHSDDINWTFEGGVLFAITVITTIGYGHVTPQTKYGRLLTMLYAVIGIPLFFCYLSKNGDVMASVFRLAYARGCKPFFSLIRLHRTRKVNTRVSNICTTASSTVNPEDNGVTNAQVSYQEHYPAYELGNKDQRNIRARARSEQIREKPYRKSRGNEEPIYVKCYTTTENSVLNQSNRRKRKSSEYEKRRRQMYKHSRKSHTIQPSLSALPTIPTTYRDETLRPDSFSYSKFPSTVSTQSVGKISTAQLSDVGTLPKNNVPICLTLCMMTVYILIGAGVFCIWESTDYIKWSYFCFVTLSTIGFGDIVPGTKIDSENPKEKLIALILYVAIGLSFFAMCFKLMEEEAVNKLRKIGHKLGILSSPRTKAASEIGGNQ